jgi:hypothetical protein
MKYIYITVLVLLTSIAHSQENVEQKAEQTAPIIDFPINVTEQSPTGIIDCKDLVVKIGKSKKNIDYSFPPNVADKSIFVHKNIAKKQNIIIILLNLVVNECDAREKGFTIELSNGETLKFSNQMIKCTHLSGNEYSIDIAFVIYKDLYRKLIKHDIVSFTLGRHYKKVSHPNPEGFKTLLKCMNDIKKSELNKL